MYAILKLNSKQFIIKEGEKLLVDFIKRSKKNERIVFNHILALSYEEKFKFGNPYLDNCKVHATVVLPSLKGKKIRVFKKKRRKGYHKTIGYRHKYTQIRIDKILTAEVK